MLWGGEQGVQSRKGAGGHGRRLSMRENGKKKTALPQKAQVVEKTRKREQERWQQKSVPNSKK